MAWACLALGGTGPLVFIVTADRSSRMDCEVHRALLSAEIQTNTVKLIRRRFAVQTDDDPRHTAEAAQEFLKLLFNGRVT